MKHLEVKLSDELYEKLKSLSEKTNKTMSDIVREAIAMYIGSEPGEKTIGDVKTYTKPALYSGRCCKCNKEIQQGDLAGFVRVVYSDKSSKTYVYCLDCFQSVSDKTIVSLEVKKHRLQRAVNALRRELSRLLKVYEEIESEKDIVNKVREALFVVQLYTQRVEQSDELKKLIFELQELNNMIPEFIRAVKIKREVYAKILSKSTH